MKPLTTLHSRRTDLGPAIVFDFGGVLVDWNPRYLYRKLFPDDPSIEEFLHEIRFMDWVREQDAGLPFDLSVATHCARYPHYCEMIRAYHHRYEETIAGAILPTVEMLRKLRDEGRPLYALSNWPTEKYLVVKPKFEFFEWFDDILISGDVGVTKPDPRIYALLLERIGRPAEECVFIDDSAANIAAAQAFGFQTILFKSPMMLEGALVALLKQARTEV